ncbi:hypothetical protein AAE02nite_20350 [Adhaeribacter aerolatus]|uniref:Xylose isomerase-like TIM barrel domain-containing protein n=2 Tax=Adhaeribacter aerolatus TaxID=670289 RepID=A0A512AXC2_9BACT|nr:hypothetical protein AAE02nite_20350 [Adhaeribacter aerolatus]
MVLALPEVNGFFKDRPMGVVVHSYGQRWQSKLNSPKYPGFKDALDLLEHCHTLGAGGVQVIVKDWTPDFAKKLNRRREKLGMYLEGSIAVPQDRSDVGRFDQEIKNAKAAGVHVLRTVCSSGRRYENYHSEAAFRELQQKALASLQLAEPVLQQHKMKLALENHKDWLANELVAMLKKLDSPWIGVTLDFGNSIALLEDPNTVIQTLVPYVFSTHVKDMALEEYADGFLLSEVPLGKGILDLPQIIALCKKHNPEVTFNLEMITRDPLEIPCLKENYWPTLGGVTGAELARALRQVRQHQYAPGLPRVSHLTPEERLVVEEQNINACLEYSKNTLALK